MIKRGMHRHALTDEQWDRLQSVLPRQRFGPRSRIGDRQFVDAVLYRGKTGIPWRDLPERFGPWKAVHTRFSRWAESGVWERVFKHLAGDAVISPVVVQAANPEPVGLVRALDRQAQFLEAIPEISRLKPHVGEEYAIAAEAALRAQDANGLAIIDLHAAKSASRRINGNLFSDGIVLTANYDAALS